ncbi:MAG: beta-galactosidase trimerization domain-containing protein [Terrimicrobiaceae bacterium]
MRIFSALLAIIGSLTAVWAEEASAPLAANDAFSRIEGGVQYVEGKPFITTAAWWGINHWMSHDPNDARGNQLRLFDHEVGGDRDFYARAGYNVGFFSIVGDQWEPNREQLLRAIENARKTGQKLVLHLNNSLPARIVLERGWTVTDEDGVTKPFVSSFIYPHPKEFGQAMRDFLKPITDAIRDEPLVIGYQIGGETWTLPSYDEQSIGRYRDFLKSEFTVEELGERYLGDKRAYAEWEQVFPPVKLGEKDFSGRELANGRVAWFDWARFNKKVHEDAWVEFLNVLNECDGRGRPISYEYNHGPYSGSAYGLYNFNFEGICERTKNFTVGPGEFVWSLAESMQGLFNKACGEGPWFTNELDARFYSHLPAQAAYFRRHIWWILALGGSGYHQWTFFNVLGAANEFVGGRAYDPIRMENVPLGFFETQHTNRMIDSLGTLLAGAKAPQMNIAMFYLEDSSMAGLVNSYQTDSYSILRSLAAHGLSDQIGIFTEHHLRGLDLSKFQVIILPRTPRILKAHEQILADYVKGGGTLLLMAPTGKSDDLFKESEVFPSGPLAEVAGIQAREIPSKERATAPLSLAWGRQFITIDVEATLRIPGNSRAKAVLLSGQKPIVTENTFGKGRCFYFAGRPLVVSDEDPTAAFLYSLLASAGVVPGAALTESGKAATGVYAGRRLFKGGGGLLILIENEDRGHDLKVKINPASFGLNPAGAYTISECFSEETHPISARNAWTFPTTVEAVGVRVYAITPDGKTAPELLGENQLIIPRDNPDAILIPSREGDEQPPYRVGDAFAGVRDAAKIETISAGELASAPPRDLGKGYVGLDIDNACNRSLSEMIKETDYSGMATFGADVARKAAGEVLPLQPGKAELGDVPVWVNGRYIEMSARRIEGVRVGTRVASLHFFHHGIYWVHESSLGYYRVCYADGSVVNVPIVVGTTLRDLDRPWGEAPRTKVVWTAKNGNRLSRFDWINPFPDRVVASIDIVRNDRPELSVWAITAKKSGAF